MIGELLYIAEPASFQNLLGDEVRFFNLVNGEAARCYGGRSGRCETVVDCGDTQYWCLEWSVGISISLAREYSDGFLAGSQWSHRGSSFHVYAVGGGLTASDPFTLTIVRHGEDGLSAAYVFRTGCGLTAFAELESPSAEGPKDWRAETLHFNSSCGFLQDWVPAPTLSQIRGPN